jgi:hypothetical protein
MSSPNDQSFEEKYRFHPYGTDCGFVNIDPLIVQKLRLSSDDYFIQEITSDGKGILLKKKKE